VTRITHYPLPITDGQQRLPLQDSRVTDPLFLAYSCSHLADHGITFEKARTTPHLRLPLQRTAEAMLRARGIDQEAT